MSPIFKQTIHQDGLHADIQDGPTNPFTQAQEIPFCWEVKSSALGYLGVLQIGSRLVACVFGHATEPAAVRALQQRWRQFSKSKARRGGNQNIPLGAWDVEAGDRITCSPLLQRLVRYAAGQPDDLLNVPLLLADRTPFQCRVLAACRAIPRGETRTYGEVAAVAGSPRAARAVGRVMATNRVPLVVPCHRVVAAGGGMGGFSAPQGVTMKGRLLTLEK